MTSGTSPELAIRLLDAIPFDLGEVPDNLDASQAKNPAQFKKLEAAYTALNRTRFMRESTFETLYAIAASDLDFQARAFASLNKLPPSSHLFHGMLFRALVSAPELVPDLRAEVERLAVTLQDTMERQTAISAVFRLGLAARLLLPLLEKLRTAEEMWHAKSIIGTGSSEKWFAKSPDAWRPTLKAISVRADEVYDYTKGDLGRASIQVGQLAREALRALETPDSAPASEAAPQTPPEKKQKPKKLVPMVKAPIDRRRLRSSKAREAAFDTLAEWIVEELANADDARARGVLHGAISAFYDVREAHEGERNCDSAGHFYMADGVGIDNTGRKVPWDELLKRVGLERLDKLREIFLEVEEDVE